MFITHHLELKYYIVRCYSESSICQIIYYNNLCDQFNVIHSGDDKILRLVFLQIFLFLIVYCFFFFFFFYHTSELLRAPFKAGKLPNGGVGLLINYNKEDILIPAEVTIHLIAKFFYFYFSLFISMFPKKESSL